MKVELSHDILAKRIYDKASSEDKMRLKIHQLLDDRLIYYKESKAVLSKDDLTYIAPYLDSIELTPDEAQLIQASRQLIKRKKRRVYAAVISTIVLLLIFNGITRSANSNNSYYLTQEQQQIALLEEEEEKKRQAEQRADSLYQVLMEQDPEFTQQLIQSYDTLQKARSILEEERNIAQSSTLSSLAETALEQDDLNYAFQLAAKSWELNHKNEHACELLYEISDKDAYNSNSISATALDVAESHDQYIQKLIDTERLEKGRGQLDAEDMEAIFENHNSVLNSKNEGVQTKVKKYFKKAEEMYHEVEQKVRQY